jgi:prolyl oligopeptidase
MNRMILSVCALGVAGALTGAADHPVARDTYHGVVVSDPYRWLENGNAPDVREWVAGQNAQTQKYFAGLSGRAAIAAELLRIEKATATYDASISQAGGRLFALTFNPGAQQPQLVTLALTGDAGSRKVILDPNQLAADGSVAIDWFEPSPDGKRVAVSLSLNGSEDGTLHVYDANTGSEIGTPIAHVQYPTAAGSVAWNATSDGFWYTRYPGEHAPEAERHFNQQAYYHELGKDSSGDPLVLSTQDGLPRTAAIVLDNRYGYSSALASVQLGDGGEWQHFLLSRTDAKKIAGYAVKIKSAALASDGTIFGITVRDAPNGKLIRLRPPYQPGAFTTIVNEGAQALVTEAKTRSIVLSGQRIFVTAIDGGPTVIRSFGLDGESPAVIETPPVSASTSLEAMPGGDLLYRARSYLRPSRSLLWQASTGRSLETPLQVRSPIDLSGFEVRRVFARSKDGTRVPISVITRKGFVADGSSALLLYGYGGYGISMTPTFVSSDWYLFLKGGGALAIANIRGGAEYGERWHSQGMLTRKQNVFDDFTAAARYLVAAKYARSDRLALQGGSNGGLLVGAVLTQNPSLARAVVAKVGIYDMLRYELDPNGVFNTLEFGSVKNAAQFRALFAYSPLHRVQAGQQYPAIFLSTGDNDGRVNPLNSRKFAAALQASGTKRPVLLRTSSKSGHGQGSSLDETVALSADITAFLFDQLGLNWQAVPANVNP